MPKGVLFDTVGKRWPDGIWHMMENGRIAAFGEARHAVEKLDPDDIVFFWHAGHGLVAAARVAGDVCASPDGWEMYRDVKFRDSDSNERSGTQGHAFRDAPSDYGQEVLHGSSHQEAVPEHG